MVLDYVNERNRYLGLTKDEYDSARCTDPTIKRQARVFLEFGESKEGYWTSERFVQQIRMAVKTAEVKYPTDEGWKHVWIFDHSNCHRKAADDSLDVSKMSVKLGGKRTHVYHPDGKPQTMNFATAVPKGLRVVLEERGVNTHGMNVDQMKEILGSRPDFKNEKSLVESFQMEEKQHIAYFLLKYMYHWELNLIERVWAQSKRYTKASCKYSIRSFQHWNLCRWKVSRNISERSDITCSHT